MKALTDTKNNLKALLPEGIDIVLKGIKSVVREDTDKYNELLLLESQYQDVTRNLLMGIINSEPAQTEFNRIRKGILDFIDSLQENHLVGYEETAAGKERPDIYNGDVLYRIPKEMQVEEEAKCVVRVAFDRKVLVEGMEVQPGDVIKDVRISEVMGAELIDPSEASFNIRSLNDTVQFVDKDLFTEWVFYVKPIAEGEHPLVLKISVIEIKDGIERKRNVVLEEKVVVVATTPTQEDGGFVKAGVTFDVPTPVLPPSNIKIKPRTPGGGTRKKVMRLIPRVVPVLLLFYVAFAWFMGGSNVVPPPTTTVSPPPIGPEPKPADIPSPRHDYVEYAVECIGSSNISLTVLFPFGKPVMEEDARMEACLMDLVRFLKNTDNKILIVGHTDASGSDSFNMELGLQRARHIQNIFIKQGISKDRITTESKGEQDPVANNEIEEGARLNRRAEIRMLD